MPVRNMWCAHQHRQTEKNTAATIRPRPGRAAGVGDDYLRTMPMAGRTRT